MKRNYKYNWTQTISKIIIAQQIIIYFTAYREKNVRRIETLHQRE